MERSEANLGYSVLALSRGQTQFKSNVSAGRLRAIDQAVCARAICLLLLQLVALALVGGRPVERRDSVDLVDTIDRRLAIRSEVPGRPTLAAASADLSLAVFRNLPSPSASDPPTSAVFSGGLRWLRLDASGDRK